MEYEDSKKMNIKTFILIIIGALLIGGIGFFIGSSFTSKDNNDINNNLDNENENDDNSNSDELLVVDNNDKEALELYKKYINYSNDNTMHESNRTIDNSNKYMTVLAINEILNEKNIILSEKYGNCFTDGVYVLASSLVTSKINELFNVTNIDFKTIFDKEYNSNINNINIKDEIELESELFDYPNLNTYSIDGTYRDKNNEFLLYKCTNQSVSEISVNTTITKIEKNSDTIIIYDEYFLTIEDGDIKYSSINGGSPTSSKSIGYYKHTFKKENDKFIWNSTVKTN